MISMAGRTLYDCPATTKDTQWGASLLTNKKRVQPLNSKTPDQELGPFFTF